MKLEKFGTSKPQKQKQRQHFCVIGFQKFQNSL